jgi:16S rRNA (cytosine967-C5)-methyltransferase
MTKADRPGRRPPDVRATPASRSARTVAFRCLQRIDHEGAYANLVTSAELERSGLSERDRKFVTELVQGTTRMRRACDALVDRFVSATPSPEVRTILRLGAYQLHHAGVPAHAAVGETVELAPKKARGFVNAVLRRVSTTPMTWPSDAVRLSYPDWIVERLVAELGADDASATLEAMNEAPSVTERDDGYVQDLGSQWVAGAVMATSGESVLDVCAAPGGKATAVAGRGVTVMAADLQPQRVGLIATNARRLDADSVLPLVADGTCPPFADRSFDHVLVDAPCSGLGTLRRRADARWRIQPSDVADLAVLQQRIIDACAPLVKPGGTFVYSVCTLLSEEAGAHDMPHDFEPITDEPRGVWRPFGVGWRVLPHDAGTDGMILLRYRRAA